MWSGTLRFVAWARKAGGAVNEWLGLTVTDEADPRLRVQDQHEQGMTDAQLRASPVEVTETNPVDVSGLATAANQLPNNHQVEVSNQVAQPLTEAQLQTEALSKEDTLRSKFGGSGGVTKAVEISTVNGNTIATPSDPANWLVISWIGMSTSENNSGEVLVRMFFEDDADDIYRWNMGAPGIFSRTKELIGQPGKSFVVHLSAGSRPVQFNYTIEEKTP